MRIKWLLKIAIALVSFAALATATATISGHLDVKSALSLAGNLLIAILGIVAFIGLNWLFEARAQSIFKKWATEQQFTVLRCERAFFGGAFSLWTTSRGQVVYFITVRDSQGTERNACVRCGSFGTGVFGSDKIEIKWMDEPKSS